MRRLWTWLTTTSPAAAAAMDRVATTYVQVQRYRQFWAAFRCMASIVDAYARAFENAMRQFARIAEQTSTTMRDLQASLEREAR